MSEEKGWALLHGEYLQGQMLLVALGAEDDAGLVAGERCLVIPRAHQAQP